MVSKLDAVYRRHSHRNRRPWPGGAARWSVKSAVIRSCGLATAQLPAARRRQPLGTSGQIVVLARNAEKLATHCLVLHVFSFPRIFAACCRYQAMRAWRADAADDPEPTRSTNHSSSLICRVQAAVVLCSLARDARYAVTALNDRRNRLRRPVDRCRSWFLFSAASAISSNSYAQSLSWSLTSGAVAIADRRRHRSAFSR
jgi:hypothetical protein